MRKKREPNLRISKKPLSPGTVSSIERIMEKCGVTKSEVEDVTMDYSDRYWGIDGKEYKKETQRHPAQFRDWAAIFSNQYNGAHMY